MKKIFTLTLVFLAMMFGVNAQYLLQEGFEGTDIPSGWTTIDNDGDGDNWYVLNNSQSSQGGFNVHSGEGHITSASYAGGVALTPDNWLITPAVNLTSNATLSFWVAGQDPSYAAEHFSVYISTTGATVADFTTTLLNDQVATGTMTEYTVNLASYTGQTVYIAFRHHNVTDMFRLNLDDVEIFAQTTDPMISASPSTVNFGTAMLGSYNDATVNVTAYNLTAAVTATTADPFTVSADGTTYGSTASLASTGGTLYLRYTPTTTGTDNGTVTLASTGATNVTVSLTGSSMDCSNTPLPYSYAFDDANMFECWQIIDANNDGKTFTYNDGDIYYPYNSSSPADDWLISPSFTFTDNQLVSFDYRAASSSYPEKFQVFAFGADTVALTGVITVNSSSFQTQYIDLSTMNVSGVYSIAFHCVSDADMYRLYITNFNVQNLTAPDVTLSGPIELEAGVAGTFTANAPMADTFSWMVDGIVAPSTTETLTYTFTTAGSHNVKVIVSNAYGSNADSMDVEVYTCEPITQFPYTDGFENNLRCWTMISMDPANNGSFGVLNNASYAYEGDHCFLFSSYSSASDYNQYLITPELQIPAGENYLFDFYYMGYSSDDNFKVLYSTTTNDLSSFTELADYQNVAEEWTETSVALPAGTKYVAINYYGDYAYYLFVDNISVGPLTAPTVTITGPTSAQTGSPVQFTAVSPLAETFAWTVDGTAVSSTTNTMFHTFTTGGNHTVGVTVSNSVGSATATLTVNVLSCNEGQSLPFYENFESEETPACWTVLDEDGDGYSWMNPGMEPYEGEGCISSASYINNVGALYPDNWLISPALTIPTQGAELSFYVAAQDASYAGEHYGVYVSTTGTAPSNFTLLYEEDLDADGGSRDQGTWKQKNVNLPYGGQTIYIAIRHFNVSDMYWINLDKLSVVAGNGIESHELNTKIFPNPANNVLNINANSNINRVEVYNMMGQMIGMYEVNDVNTQISTTALANGVYTVKIATENGTSTQKFTVAR